MDNFDVKELSFTNSDQHVYGTVYVPHSAADGGRLPAILYAHGLGGSGQSGEKWAREFARRGYVVYCIDFRGGGPESRSEGEMLDMTLFSEITDYEHAYNLLVKQSYVDANNVFLMGSSMGGLVAAMTAMHMPGLFKGMILNYPAFCIPEQMQVAFSSRSMIPETFELFDYTLGKAFIDDIYDLDVYKEIAAYKGPVLILHGTEDDLVPSSYSIIAVKTYARANLELLSGAGHGFEGGYFKYAVKKIVSFLDEETDLADESGLEGDLNFGGPGMGGMFGA